MLKSAIKFTALTFGLLAAAATANAQSTKVLEKFEPDAPITMTFRKAHFLSGHDLKDFAEKLGMELRAADVEQ